MEYLIGIGAALFLGALFYMFHLGRRWGKSKMEVEVLKRAGRKMQKYLKTMAEPVHRGRDLTRKRIAELRERAKRG